MANLRNLHEHVRCTVILLLVGVLESLQLHIIGIEVLDLILEFLVPTGVGLLLSALQKYSHDDFIPGGG